MEEEFEDVKTIRGIVTNVSMIEELELAKQVSQMPGMNITVQVQPYADSIRKIHGTRLHYVINIFDKKSEMYFKLRFAGTLI